MPRLLTCLLILLMLEGCTSYSADYQQRLIRSLPNQREVNISNSRTYPGRILCGSYTTLTFDGFSMRGGKFVVGEDMVLSSPSDDEVAVFCSEQPMRALYTRLGIGGPEREDAALGKIRDDMQAIDAAINRYYNTANALPRTLEVLQSGDFGISAEQLSDPWGRAYLYEGGLSGRTVPQYQLRTLGADGAPGGRGAAADISRRALEMLDHALTVAGS